VDGGDRRQEAATLLRPHRRHVDVDLISAWAADQRPVLGQLAVDAAGQRSRRSE
jgi:hypothetical protein